MANFRTRVDDLTAFTTTDDTALADWLAEGCKVVINAMPKSMLTTVTGETGDYTTIDVNINSVGRLSVDAYDGVADATVAAYNTAATGPIYRDPTAWYHFVFAFDTGDGTAGNRFKWYVNGSNQTANLATTTTPSQNADLFHASSSSFDVGYDRGDTSYHDGYISEVYYCDGYQYAASDFGETNDNGVWIPKKFTGSYGTNGIKLEFQETGTSAKFKWYRC